MSRVNNSSQHFSEAVKSTQRITTSQLRGRDSRSVLQHVEVTA